MQQPQPPLFPHTSPHLTEIDISDIEPWETTGRNAVIKSVAALGLTTAIQVEELLTTTPGLHRYRVIDGRRRLDAAKRNTITRIPALVFPPGGGAAYEAMAATANLARAVAPIDEAHHIERLMASGFTPEQIASELGISTSTVRQRLKLITLPPSVRDAVREKRLTPSVASAIAGLTPSESAKAEQLLRSQGTLKANDVSGIRQAERDDTMRQISALFDPPAPPDPIHTFEIAVRAALTNGLNSDELRDTIDRIEREVIHAA